MAGFTLIGKGRVVPPVTLVGRGRVVPPSLGLDLNTGAMGDPSGGSLLASIPGVPAGPSPSIGGQVDTQRTPPGDYEPPPAATNFFRRKYGWPEGMADDLKEAQNRDAASLIGASVGAAGNRMTELVTGMPMDTAHNWIGTDKHTRAVRDQAELAAREPGVAQQQMQNDLQQLQMQFQGMLMDRNHPLSQRIVGTAMQAHPEYFAAMGVTHPGQVSAYELQSMMPVAKEMGGIAEQAAGTKLKIGQADVASADARLKGQEAEAFPAKEARAEKELGIKGFEAQTGRQRAELEAQKVEYEFGGKQRDIVPGYQWRRDVKGNPVVDIYDPNVRKAAAEAGQQVEAARNAAAKLREAKRLLTEGASASLPGTHLHTQVTVLLQSASEAMKAARGTEADKAVNAFRQELDKTRGLPEANLKEYVLGHAPPKIDALLKMLQQDAKVKLQASGLEWHGQSKDESGGAGGPPPGVTVTWRK